MLVTFIVEGRPVPQGSMVASYNRKRGVSSVHHVQGAALAQWRASIREAAREAYGDRMPSRAPVGISLVFRMPRPLSHYKITAYGRKVNPRYMGEMPISAPDIDKLTRAVLDSLEGVLYHNDSQVVLIYALEIYGETGALQVTAQDAPGLGAHETNDFSEGQSNLWNLPETRRG